MKSSSFWVRSVVAVSLGAVLGARGANLVFDANTASASAQDGSGIWTNGAPVTNWWNGLRNTNWNSAVPDSAQFGNGGGGGTVTVVSPVSVGDITFAAVASTNYVIQSNTVTLVGTPVISAAAQGTINSILAGSGFLKTGTATLVLGGANTYTGQTTLSAGIIQANNSSALGTGALSITNAAVRLVVGNGVTLANPIIIGTNAGAAGNGLVQVNGTATGTVSGPITINNNAAGGGHFASAAAATARLNVNGAITSSVTVVSRLGFVVYSGGGSYPSFTVSQDTVGIGANNGIATGAVLNVAGSAAGTFDLRGFNQTLGGIYNSTTATITNSTTTPVTLALNAAGVQIYSGRIGGPIRLIKNDGGTQVLSGASTFLGDLTVNGGLLKGTLAGAFGSSATNRVLTVNNGGTLDFGVAGVFGAHSTKAMPTLVINAGGTAVNTLGNQPLNDLSLFGGTLTSTNGNGQWGAWNINGNVTATGTSFISSTLTSGAEILLASGTGATNTTFNVVNAGDNLTISVSIFDGRDTANPYPPHRTSLTKTGAGTLTFSTGAGRFSGDANISSGTFVLSGGASLPSVSVVRVASGAVFDVTPNTSISLVPGQTLQGSGTVLGQLLTDGSGSSRVFAGSDGTPGTLTITGDYIVASTAFTNSFDLTNDVTVGSGVNDLIDVTGQFEPLGSIVRIRALAPLTSGTYRLVNYGTKATSFDSLQGNTYRDTWTLDESAANQINLIVAAGTNQSLVWQPQLDGNWDILTTTNWTNSVAQALDVFADNDSVLFDDSGAAFNTVNLASLVKPASITVLGTSNYTFTGAGGIGNSFSATRLTKDGSGTLTLGTANSHSGGTVISNGTVVLAVAGATGGGPVEISPGALVDEVTGGSITGALGGTGTFRKSAGGALTFGGQGSFAGTLEISNGLSVVVSTQAYLNASAFTGGIANDGSLIFLSSTQTISGTISGTGSVTLTSTGQNMGALTLTGSNTMSGPTIAIAGTLLLASTNGPSVAGNLVGDNNLSPDVYMTKDNQFGPGALLMMTNNAGDHVRIELLGTTQTVAGIHTLYAAQKGVIQHREIAPTNLITSTNSLLILNGDGQYFFSGYLRDQSLGRIGVTKIGTGTQTLWGTVIDQTGPTTIGAGSLVVTNVDDLWSTGLTISNGASLVIDTSARAFQYRGKATVNGGGSIVMIGGVNSTLWGNNNNGVTMAMDPGALLDIRAGLFRNEFGAFNNWSNNFASLGISNGASFWIWDANTFADALNGAGFVDKGQASVHNFTVGTAGGSGVFDGNIRNTTGTLHFAKTGAGHQTLNGILSYTGNTTVASGTLALGASTTVTGSPRIVTGPGAVLDVTAAGTLGLVNFQSLEGGGTVSGNVTTATGSRIVPGGTSTAATLGVSGSLIMTAGSTNYFDLAANDTTIGGGINDLVTVGGDLEPLLSVIAITPQLYSNGIYRLFQYSGTKSSTFNPAIPGNTTRKTWTINESAGGQINLVISGTTYSLKWNSQTSTNWDINVGANWLDIAGLTNTVFFDSDSVLFDDSGAATNTIGFSGTLVPGGITVSASSNYSITGGGRLTGGGALVKDGTGVLTLGGVNNDFTGGVTVSNGTLRVGGNGILPHITTTMIESAGTVEYALGNATYTITNAFAGAGRILLTFSGATANNAYLIGTNTAFTGTLELAASGVVGSKLNVAGLNLNTAAVIRINSGATMFTAGGAVIPLAINFAGSGNNENRGAIRLGPSQLSGPLTLTGSASIGLEGGTNIGPISAGAPGSHSLTLGTGSAGGTGLFTGQISDGSGVLELIVSNGTATVLGTNTYSGGTRINGGTLVVGSLSDSGTSGIANSGQLSFGGGTLRYDGAAPVVLARTVSILAGTATWNITNAAASITLSGPVAGGGALTKTGPGPMTLAGTNTHTGTTTLNQGDMTFAATSSNAIGAITVNGGLVGSLLTVNGPVTATNSILTVGGGANDRSRARITADMRLLRLYVGNNSTAAGSVRQDSGNVTAGAGIGGSDVLSLGMGNGGYGYYEMNGGTLTVGQLGAGGGSTNTSGVFDMKGGVVNVTAASGWLLAGGWAANSKGAFNIFGGTISGPPGNPVSLSIFNNNNAYGSFNLLGSTSVLIATNNVNGINILGGSNNINAAFNLNAGTVITPRVYQSAIGPAQFNFNGGTLRARPDSVIANFLALNTGGAAHIYGGGGSIDSTNSTVTVTQPILAPAGNGVTSIAVGTPGTGYIGAPLVVITGGGGTGATAIAQMDLAAGTLTNLLIVCPGVNYSGSPTVTLVGGGATNAGTAGTVTLAPNVSGGLTKLGSGALLLHASNTFTGASSVNAGNLFGTGSVNAAVSVLSGATIGPTLSGGLTGTFTVASLSISNGGTLSTFLRGTTATIRATGNFNISPSTFIQLVTGPITNIGTHVLVDYDGTFNGSIADFSMAGLPAGAYITNNLANTSIDLVITNLGNSLRWTGLVNNQWKDAGETNWVLVADSTPVIYNPFDFVLFDDTAAAYTVEVAGAVSPSSVTINNDTNEYVFSGSGSIALGTITKSGTGQLTLASATALGPAGQNLAMNGGSLRLANDSDINPYNLNVRTNITITSDRATAGTARTNTLASLALATNALAVTVTNGVNITGGTAVINVSGRGDLSGNGATLDIASGNTLNILGSAGSAPNSLGVLNKNGLGTLIVSGGNTWWDHTIVAVNNGTLIVRNANAINEQSSTAVSIGTNATFQFGLDGALANKGNVSVIGNGTILLDRFTLGAGIAQNNSVLTFNGANTLFISAGANVTSGTASVSYNSAVLGGDSTINVAGPNGAALTAASITGLVSQTGGPRSLTKDGGGTLTLIPKSPNNYTGGTVVNGGVLQLGFSDTGANYGTIVGTVTVNTGAVIRSIVDKGFGFASLATAGVQTVILNAGRLEHTGASGHGSGQTVFMTAGEIRSNGGTNTTTGGSYRIGGSGTNPTIYVLSSASTSLITGRVSMDIQGRFDVEDGAAEIDLIIKATITDGIGAGNPPNGFIKTNAGTMAVTASNIYSGVTFVNGGKLLVNNGTGSGTGTNLVNVAIGGTLGGTGTIAGTVNSDGTVAPGASPGILNIRQNYNQNSGGTLAIEIGGTTAGSQHDQLNVTGTAQLNGALNVSLTNGFTPAYGDSFLIVVAGTVSGTFTTTNLPTLVATNAWDVQYFGNAIILSIIAASATPTGYNAFSNNYVLVQGPEGDDDGDGYANLLEYVSGSNPTNSGSNSALSAARTNGLFALKFLRDTNTIDATLIVEGAYSPSNNTDWIGFATNLAGSWGSATNVVEDLNNPANVTAYDIVPAATNRFLRLRITRP